MPYVFRIVFVLHKSQHSLSDFPQHIIVYQTNRSNCVRVKPKSEADVVVVSPGVRNGQVVKDRSISRFMTLCSLLKQYIRYTKLG